MSREEAMTTLRNLADGLDPDLAGTRRFMNRVAAHGDREQLLGVLLEQGARSLLSEGEGGRQHDR